MELLKLYTALLRRRWLIVQSVVLFTIVGGMLAILLPKNYTASARVLVSTSDSSLSILSDLGLGEIAAGLSQSTDDIQNKISLATARPVLDEVIWKLQLRDGDGRLYNAEELLIPGTTGELLAKPNIAVSSIQSTDLLLFEARTDDPELSRLLADTVVRIAIKQSQERAKEDTGEARLFIEQQLIVVREEFDKALADIADEQAAEEVIDIDSEMKAAIARLSELMLGFEQNAAAIQETRARMSSQRAYQGRESVDQVSPVTAGVNQKVAQLQERLVSLQGQRTGELNTKTDKHPDVVSLDRLIVATQVELANALTEQHAMDPTIAQLQAQLSGFVDKGAEIQASIERTTAEFSTYPDKMRRMGQLKLAATAAETVYKSLQEQNYQVGVAQAMLVSDLLLIEAAKAPDKQSSPRLFVNLMLGFACGLVFGLGAAFLFEYIDDTIKGPDDLHEAWSLNRLGIVPQYKTATELRTIDVLEVTHPVAEAYRTVRNGLLYASLDKPLALVAVSSSVPGEGKSTFVVNLAISFAREGKKVLVADLDLRRPSQHRMFSTVNNHVGLTDVLTGNLTLSDAIQVTPVEGLSVLTSGSVPADPGRLVESLKLRQVLLDLRRQFDVVVVDTPPALVVNDALVIGRAVDGTVLIVESGETSRKLVVDLRGRYEAAGIEPVGLVLNKMDFRTTGYGHYAKAYKKYHDSQRDQGTEGPPAQSGGGVA